MHQMLVHQHHILVTLTIGVNAVGDAGDASQAIFGQPGTKCLIPPKFDKIVIKLPTDTMRTAQPSFAVPYKQDTEIVRGRVIGLGSLFCMSCDAIHYALLGCAYTSGLMRDECQSHISC